MNARPFVNADELVTLQRAERRAAIRAEMQLVAAAAAAKPVEVLDVRGLAANDQVQHTHAWTRWDWMRWGAPFLGLGFILGAVTDLLVRVFA